MDENDMSIANQNRVRDLPVLHKKLLSQPALSPSRSKTVPATSATEMKSPVSKPKPKQRYLKRGTGLQTRLAAAKQKRYVPKGGFIKGQAEDEAVQQPYVPASSLPRDSGGLEQAGQHSMPAVWPQLADPSSVNAEEPSPPPHRQYGQAGMAHRQSQENSQPYAHAADQEAEMDADTALVHFPGTAPQSRQGHDKGQQQFEPYICAHHPTAASHGLKGGRSLQQQDRPHADLSMQNDPLQAAYMQSSADNGVAPVDWQLQQAAEALELEEFRALERQITQDSGMSVRGSVASLSAVTGMHNPIAGLKADAHMLTQSEHRTPLAPMSQPIAQSLAQAQDQHQMPWQYPASQAAESDSSLHEAYRAHNQAPRQLPSGRVTGNPFAEPENFDRPATSLLSHQQKSIEQGWDEQAPSYARHSSRAQSVDQPQVDLYAEAQQATSVGDFKHESAWEAAQGPAHNSAEASQDVQSGLQSARASQSYIQGLFRQQQPTKPACDTKMEHLNDTQAASIAALEQEMKDMQSERAKVSKLRAHLEQASTRMDQEKAAWERKKAEEAASWESEKEADSQRLKRHQRVLDKQSRALLKLPNRKERSEVEAVEAILEQERKAAHAKDARHKLTVERLRQKLVELQDTNAELREEIRFHEQRRLEEWNAKENQQPTANSKGRAAGGALSGAATSTNRSKPALSPQEASSKPGHLQAAAAQHAPAIQSSQPASIESITAIHEEAAQTSTASLADDVSQADCVEVGEAVTEQLAGPATANAMQWRVQRHGMSAHAHIASQRADQQPQRGLENSMQAAYDLSHGFEGTPEHKAQPMEAFQPIASMKRSDAASWGSSMAAQQQQQGGQANHVTKADRYQHATMLDSPDEFTWQPIRPPHDGNESRLEAPQNHSIPSAQADQWNQNHMASIQQGYRQGDSYSRSLRQSLDAAARLDACLQGAQQQQQHADASHQEAGQQHQYTAAVKAGLGSSSSWQDLQEAYAAAQPQAQSQIDGLQSQQQQQCHQEQQTLVGEGGQARKASRGSMYDGPILMDRSRPQTAADAPAATLAMGRALTQSAQAHGLPGSWASHSAVDYSSDRGPSSQVLNDDTCAAHDQQWVRAGSTTAAQQGIAHSMQEHQQRSAGDEHLSSAGGVPEKPYQELSYPDGKVEQIFLDGRRTVVFGNGTRKHQFPDGHTAVRFTNKDIKRFYPCGRVEYYYHEVDTWHTTHANGIEVFYFPNGQTEAHHPLGTKEIIFPDGVIRRVFTDGREQDVTPEQLSGPVKYPMPEDRD